jgi:hypothetical protein
MAGHTLRKALAKNSALPDTHGLYSTKQITDAVFGGLHEEKLLTQRELTKRYALDNEIVEASVLDRKALSAAFGQLADTMTFIISTSGLPRESQDDLRRELASIPIVLEGVAASQTRLPRRSKNGQTVEEDENES